MDPAAQAVVNAYAERFVRASADVATDLEQFAQLLKKWQQAQNLVSRETLDQVWPRHIADSLQLLTLLRPEDRVILDLGSGGGFPAIPIAIALKGGATRFHLVESNGRKAAFLRAAARTLGLSVAVHGTRVEDLDPDEIGHVDVITSRALAGLPVLLALSMPFWGRETRALFSKGRGFGGELAKSSVGFAMDVVEHASQTDDSGVILEITHLQRKSEA